MTEPDLPSPPPPHLLGLPDTHSLQRTDKIGQTAFRVGVACVVSLLVLTGTMIALGHIKRQPEAVTQGAVLVALLLCVGCLVALGMGLTALRSRAGRLALLAPVGAGFIFTMGHFLAKIWPFP